MQAPQILPPCHQYYQSCVLGFHSLFITALSKYHTFKDYPITEVFTSIKVYNDRMRYSDRTVSYNPQTPGFVLGTEATTPYGVCTRIHMLHDPTCCGVNILDENLTPRLRGIQPQQFLVHGYRVTQTGDLYEIC